VFDDEGRRDLTLAQARDRVAELRKIYRSGVSDTHRTRVAGNGREGTALEAAEEAAQQASWVT
jgi:hypothetical protein